MNESTDTPDDWPDATMNRRNWLFDRWTWALTYSAIVLIPIALLLTKAFALVWLSVLMALGPLLAGLWLFATSQLEVDGRLIRELSVERLIQSLMVAVAIGLLAFLVIILGRGGWFSYSVLKSGGLAAYSLLGLLPVISYAAILQWLLTKRWSLGWMVGLGLVSLLAPWFWSGFAVYAATHTL